LGGGLFFFCLGGRRVGGGWGGGGGCIGLVWDGILGLGVASVEEEETWSLGRCLLTESESGARGSGGGGMMFLDFMVPSRVMAGCEGRCPRRDVEIEKRIRVESLAKPASTLMRLVLMGTVFNQSMKRPGEKSEGWTSSETRMLKRSLGYSRRGSSEVVDDDVEALRLNRAEDLGVLGSSGD
jgi:hypothetical protein